MLQMGEMVTKVLASSHHHHSSSSNKGFPRRLHPYLFIALLGLSLLWIGQLPSTEARGEHEQNKLLNEKEGLLGNFGVLPHAVPPSRRRQLIYNGWQTTTEDYPFGAALVQDNLQHVCSGSLITPGVVLTAAHCFSDNAYVYDYNNDFTHRRQEEIKFTSSYRVILGRDESGNHNSSDAIGISKVIIGEPFEFHTGSASWDLALVFLDTCQLDYEPIKLLQDNIWDTLRQSMQEHHQLDSSTDTGTGGDGEASSSENNSPSHASVAESLLQKPVSVIGWGDTEGQCVKLQREEDEIDEMMEMLYQVESCEKDSFCEESPELCDSNSTICMQKHNVASCDGDSGAPIFIRVSEAELHGGNKIPTTDKGGEAAVQSVAIEEESYQYVQVGVLSGGQVILNNELDVRNSHRMKQGDLTFVDHARGALLTGYTNWLKIHLETDPCLTESDMTSEDIFVTHY